MSYGSYNQYDSRWGKKNYNGSSNMAAAGCGPTSCANILHNLKSSITPVTTMKYMQSHGYAIRNQGTAHAGIPACLKAYGATNVSQPDVSQSMTKVWDALKQGYAAIFLMRYRKGLKGPTWTTSGHFIAIVGYKYKNKKHYVKVEDSGGRGHDGWYCYETQMRGWIPKAWVCLAKPKEILPVVKPIGQYSGSIPSPTLRKDMEGTGVKELQLFLTWYGIKLEPDGKFGSKTELAVERFQKTENLTVDGVYGSMSYAKAKDYLPKDPVEPDPVTPEPTPKPEPEKPKTKAEKIIAKVDELAYPYGTPKKTWAYKTGKARPEYKAALKKYLKKSAKISQSDCGYFVSTCIRAAGISKSFLALRGRKESFPAIPSSMKIVHKGKKIPSGLLQPGDVIRYKKKGGGQHTLMYYGNGKIVEAGRGHYFPAVKKDTKKYNKSNVKKSTIQVLRAR